MMPPPCETAAEAHALALANVSEPADVGESANASGWLLPDQMRYFRVRPPHANVRILVTVHTTQGAVRLFARRGAAPGAVWEVHGSPLMLPSFCRWNGSSPLRNSIVQRDKTS